LTLLDLHETSEDRVTHVLQDAPEPALNRGDGPLRDFFQDIGYTLRLLGRAPAFTAIAVATLASRAATSMCPATASRSGSAATS
jgi:hypothetical protein